MIRVLHVLVVIVLTALTQIGGLAYLLALLIGRGLVWRVPVFAALYVGLGLAAPYVSGRVPVVEEKPAFTAGSLHRVGLYRAMHRQYVRPEVNVVLNDLAAHMVRTQPGAVTHVLDGNFPYFDGFPLLPHLSHQDGRKVDIALYYQGGGMKSPLGYFAFEAPRTGDPQPCEGRGGALRWDMGWVQGVWRKMPMDEAATAEAIRWLATEGRKLGVTKIFVEPHLVRRLKLDGLGLNFQGCGAARHDDHIHFQVR